MSASHHARAAITAPALPPLPNGTLTAVGITQMSPGDPSCTPPHDLEVTWTTTGTITACLCDVYIEEGGGGFVLQAMNVPASDGVWDGLSQQQLYEDAGGTSHSWTAKVFLKDQYGRNMDTELSSPHTELVKIATCF